MVLLTVKQKTMRAWECFHKYWMRYSEVVGNVNEVRAVNSAVRCAISKTENGWMIDAYIGDDHVGELSIGAARYGREGYSAMNVAVDKEYRRKGVATAMYDFAYKSGLAPLYPDSKQSDAGSNFWHGVRMKKLKLGKPMPPMEWGKLRGLRKPKPFTELFDSGQQWAWVSKDSSEWLAKFQVGDIPYYVAFSGVNAVFISFTAITKGEFGSGPAQHITGTGSAQKVFSTVLEIIRAFIKERQPPVFGFSSKKNQPSRVRLYRKMIQALGDVPGYKFTEEDTDNQHHDSVNFYFDQV